MVLRREAEVGLLGARAMEWNLNGSGEQTRWKRGQVVEGQQGQGVTGDGCVVCVWWCWWCWSGVLAVAGTARDKKRLPIT